MSTLLKTPLHDIHLKLGARNVGFCGWDMPIQYSSIIAEHGFCRNEAALFDTSHMGELFFEGDIVKSGMNEATSIDIASLRVGKCKYGFLLNEQGGVIDDLIVYKKAEDNLMIVVNAARVDIDFETLKSRVVSGKLENNSQDFAKIDIQGPMSKEILVKHFDIDLDSLGFFSFVETKFHNDYCLLSRTGYTGELGFELYIGAQSVLKLWEVLVSDGAKPAGLGARDALRLEVGYSLYGNDLTEAITPLEANLGFFINLKQDFIGKDALVKQKEQGLKRLLLPFKTKSRRSARKDFKVFQNDQEIGFVTSAAFSPILSVGIGLAMINMDGFDKEQVIFLRDERTSIEANISKLPFIKR